LYVLQKDFFMGNKIILVLLLVAQHASALDISMSLKEAVKQKLVQAHFTANGRHLGKCLKADIVGLTEDTINLVIEPGTYVESTNSDYQNLYVTAQSKMLIKGIQHITRDLFAMCGTKTKRCPKEFGRYLLANTTDQLPIQMCKLFDSLHQQDNAAQEALWIAIARENPIQINGYKLANVRAMRKLVARHLRMDYYDDIQVSFEEKGDPAYKLVSASVAVPLGKEGNYFLVNEKDEAFAVELFSEDGDFIRKIPFDVLNVGQHNSFLKGLQLTNLEEGLGYYARISLGDRVVKEWRVDVVL
jgi:hypothetical protein